MRVAEQRIVKFRQDVELGGKEVFYKKGQYLPSLLVIGWQYRFLFDIFLSRLYDVILMDLELFIAFYLIMKIDSCNFTQLFKMLVVKFF